MEFSPHNAIVKLCLEGLALEKKGSSWDAQKLYLQAWNSAGEELEKFIAAHFLARSQQSVSDKLKWFETALQLALKINDDTVNSAVPFLYSEIGKCHEQLQAADAAKANYDLAASFKDAPAAQGPFYHGTRADLRAGDLLTAGGISNYKADLKMNHIYFTGLPGGAGLAAALAKGERRERVYIVEPTGPFENDPNVTNKVFPGNPTRSYRSLEPLKITGEIEEWPKPSAAEIQRWRERLAKSTGEIIN